MKPADPGEHRKTQTREKILTAARELLLADGFHGFSMRKLAAKVHYTATAIYFHFPR
jgi:AcrR family transcriptional regulator